MAWLISTLLCVLFYLLVIMPILAWLDEDLNPTA